MSAPARSFSLNTLRAELVRARRRRSGVEGMLAASSIEPRIRERLEAARRRLVRDEQVMLRALLVLTELRSARRRRSFLDGLRTFLQSERDAIYHDQEAVKALDEVVEELGGEFDDLGDEANTVH